MCTPIRLISILLTATLGLSVAEASECDAAAAGKTQIYNSPVAGQSYPSGFVDGDPNTPDLAHALSFSASLANDPHGWKRQLNRMSVKELIYWLHDFTFTEHTITIWALELRKMNPNGKVPVPALSSSWEASNFAIGILSKKSSLSLKPYFFELEAMATILHNSYSALTGASYTLRNILERVTRELPDANIKAHRAIILRGLLNELMSDTQGLTAIRHANLLKWTKEWVDLEGMSPYLRFLSVARSIYLECIIVAQKNKELSDLNDARKLYISTLVDQMPNEFDMSTDAAIDPKVLNEIGKVLDALRSEGNWLTTLQKAKLQFYADALASRR